MCVWAILPSPSNAYKMFLFFQPKQRPQVVNVGKDSINHKLKSSSTTSIRCFSKLLFLQSNSTAHHALSLDFFQGSVIARRSSRLGHEPLPHLNEGNQVSLNVIVVLLNLIERLPLCSKTFLLVSPQDLRLISFLSI